MHPRPSLIRKTPLPNNLSIISLSHGGVFTACDGNCLRTENSAQHVEHLAKPPAVSGTVAAFPSPRSFGAKLGTQISHLEMGFVVIGGRRHWRGAVVWLVGYGCEGSRDAFYIMAIPVIIVFLRKPLDALLTPLQKIKQHIPRLLLIGAGLAAPYLVADFIYKHKGQWGLGDFPTRAGASWRERWCRIQSSEYRKGKDSAP